jgi:hypothetical protein
MVFAEILITMTFLLYTFGKITFVVQIAFLVTVLVVRCFFW